MNKEFAWKLIPTLKDKIDCEEDIQKINWCLSNFDDNSRDVAGKIVNVLDFDILTSKLESEDDIIKISFFIDEIVWASRKSGLKLLGKLNPENVRNPDARERIIELKKEYLSYNFS